MDTFVLELLSHLDVQSVFLPFACSDIPQRWKSQSARSELNVGWVSYPQWCVGKQLLEIWSTWNIFLRLVDCKAAVNTLLLQSTVISEGSNIDSAGAGLKFLCFENQSCVVLLEQVSGLLR
jgi:hypothetical protein